MKEKILENLENPEGLESLYRTDPKSFASSFFQIFPNANDNTLVNVWIARLNADFNKDISANTSKSEILFLLISCLAAGILIEIPNLFGNQISSNLFYMRNAGLIAFFGLSSYSLLLKEVKKISQIILTIVIFLISAIYANLLPAGDSQTIILVYLHLPLMIWCLYGLIFVDFDMSAITGRTDYLKHNGDLIILGTLLLITGGILTAITINLFSSINLNIEYSYTHYIIPFGLVSVPIVTTFILRKNLFIKNKIAPIIANIFSPIVLITLVVFLISIFVTGKDPYNDRNFLLIFNAMLIGVMGIVVFSIAETSTNKRQRFSEIVLFILAIVTLIIDLIALSAILYRLGEFGFTPNRIVVLGSNLLIFGNLLIITFNLFGVIFKGNELKTVDKTIAKYLPVYVFWTIFVVFILPIIFGYK